MLYTDQIIENPPNMRTYFWITNYFMCHEIEADFYNFQALWPLTQRKVYQTISDLILYNTQVENTFFQEFLSNFIDYLGIQ